jgi:hypothetical protein
MSSNMEPNCYRDRQKPITSAVTDPDILNPEQPESIGSKAKGPIK